MRLPAGACKNKTGGSGYAISEPPAYLISLCLFAYFFCARAVFSGNSSGCKYVPRSALGLSTST